MRMLDGNSAAELDNDLRQTKADRAFSAFESQAREDAQYRWWRDLSMDDVIGALCNLTAADSEEFLKACRRCHFRDAGASLITALNRAADYYLETKSGQEAIAERVWQIDQEGRDL